MTQNATIKISTLSILSGILAATTGSSALAKTAVTLNDFYKPINVAEITPENMQSWPYYKHVSTHWDEYGLFGTVPIMAAKNPAPMIALRS